MNSVNFLTFWRENRNTNIYLPAERKTSLSLWKISEEMISAYTHQAKIYFEYNYIKNKDLHPLATSLSELFLNISDHSKSKVSGFCLTQYYPSSGKIKFSVCDFGVGIPNSINNYFIAKGLETMNDPDCLNKAFELRFTTQSTPRNRGFGLDTIKTIILSNKGSLKLVSNFGFYSLLKNEIQMFETKKAFNGTIFEIILNIEHMSTKSEDTEDFDFNDI